MRAIKLQLYVTGNKADKVTNPYYINSNTDVENCWIFPIDSLVFWKVNSIITKIEYNDEIYFVKDQPSEILKQIYDELSSNKLHSTL